MTNTKKKLAEKIETNGVQIYESSDSKLVFGKGDCLCTVIFCYDIVTCDVSKAIIRDEPGPDEFRKINDLINETRFGKHSLKYNPKKRKFDYIFSVEFSSKNYLVYETIQYALRPFSIAYDIMVCPDIKTAYQMIAKYQDVIASAPKRRGERRE